MNKSVIDNLLTGITQIKTDAQKEIFDEEILTMIKTAHLAPSADNSQIWRFLLIKDKNKIIEICNKTNLDGNRYNRLILALAAPFVIKHVRREQPFYAIDVPIAISHILLQGRELNIKTDILFIFENKEIYNVLKIPQKYKPVAILGFSKYAD